MSYKQIVALIGMPRSGTSWLGQIFDSSEDVAYRLEPIFSYAFKNQVGPGSTREDYVRFFDGIYASDDAFMLQKDKRAAGLYPTFGKNPAPSTLAFKTTRFHHIMEDILRHFGNLRMMSIVRHPCGAIHSWLNTKKEFPGHLSRMEHWRSGACRKTAPEEFWGFDDWVNVTRMHLQFEREYPDQFMIVRYEDLAANTLDVVGRMFAFASIELGPQTRDFIESCHERHDEDDYSVYKSARVMDKWRDALEAEIREAILHEVRGNELERFL